MTIYKTLQVDTVDHKAIILLNRPEKLNAFDSQMVTEMGEVWDDLRQDDDVWTIILSGLGRGFCSGIDLSGPGWRSTTLGKKQRDPGYFLSPKAQRVYKPLVVAINGVCAGGGFYFVVDADIVICSERAYFTEPHTSHGRVAGVEMVGLRWRIPPAWVIRMALMGKHERISPQQALQIGLTTEVVAPDRLLERANQIADTINLNAPLACRDTVETFWRSMDMSREASMEFAYSMAIGRNVTTADYEEGRQSFLSRKAPRWSGQ